MQAFKAKTISKNVTDEKPMQLFDEGPQNGNVRIQAVYYSSTNPSRNLYLYDGDGDMCMFPLPGQDIGKVNILPSPITVKLPLHYIDEEGEGSEIIVFGELLAQ